MDATRWTLQNKMKILLVNKFLYPKGGDAVSMFTTGKLLESKGHQVAYWGMKHPDNPRFLYEDFFVDQIEYNIPLTLKQKVILVLKILYSVEAKQKIKQIIDAFKPDIIHLNNFAHQISPSILHVINHYGIPTVQTLHDYKIVCPAYGMFYEGEFPCNRCKHGRYYWCFLKKCTKNSRAKSLVNVIEMYLHHKILHVYDLINIYIAPSRFMKEKVIEMGFKNEIMYLSNFIETERFIPDFVSKEQSICYFGRITNGKGLETLIKAAKGLTITVKIIGKGPIEELLKELANKEGVSNVKFLGYMSGNELQQEIKESIAVVLPSEWYENNPISVLEAFALGKPVIGSRIGGIPELVKDGETGYTFEAGNAEDLIAKITKLLSEPTKIIQMGRNARKLVEDNFNPEKHYQELIKSYQIASAKKQTNG
ncbi:MAG: glycosyltransferase family 4 protein [Elusimicrobiota bacterium]